MDTKKASNARDLGPMTIAVAAELRAELARAGISASKLAEQSGIPKSTLHRTLRPSRAIDMEDLFGICDHLDAHMGALIDRAAATARAQLEPELLPVEESGLTPDEYDNLIEADTRFGRVDGCLATDNALIDDIEVAAKAAQTHSDQALNDLTDAQYADEDGAHTMDGVEGDG